MFCRALSLYLRDTSTVQRLDLGTEAAPTRLRHQITFSGSLALTFETGEVRSFFGEGNGTEQELELAGGDPQEGAALYRPTRPR